jgi:hypothetical protein
LTRQGANNGVATVVSLPRLTNTGRIGQLSDDLATVAGSSQDFVLAIGPAWSIRHRLNVFKLVLAF